MNSLSKLQEAIKHFEDKIKAQGHITNARDEEHLSSLKALEKELQAQIPNEKGYVVHKFESVQDLVLETSASVIDSEDSVKLSIEIGIDDVAEHGYFEVYDIKTGGNKWYAEGGLWFEGKELVDYDGVFDLIKPIKDKLKELGYTL